jgi:hypothetical protein
MHITFKYKQVFFTTYNLYELYTYYKSTNRNFLKEALEQHSQIITNNYSLEYDAVIYPIHLWWCIRALMNMLVSKHHSQIPFLHKCSFSHVTSYISSLTSFHLFTTTFITLLLFLYALLPIISTIPNPHSTILSKK